MRLNKNNSMDRNISRQLGLSMIEMLVGVVIALISAIFIGNIYITNIKATRDVGSAARLENDLRAAMSLIVEEVRRAGYWGDAIVEDAAAGTTTAGAPDTNPFADTTTAIGTGKRSTDEADDSCITFGYDRDGDGGTAYGDIDDDEKRGFRHVIIKDAGGNITDGYVEVRTELTSGSTLHTCDETSGWDAITDENVVFIDELLFRVEGVVGEPSSRCVNTSEVCTTDCEGNALAGGAVMECCWNSLCTDTTAVNYTAPNSDNRLIEKRLVKITLSGYLKADSEVKKTLEEYVEVRNNRVILEP